MTASVSEIGEAAFGLIQAGQGGFELGNTTNAYDAYTAGLNLIAGMAGTSPFGVGLNAAATANNTAAVVSRFQSGTLQPSDIMALTASGLTLVAAAAAATGAPITLSAVVLAGLVGMVAGPGPLQSQFNEYANWLGQKMMSGLLGSVPANAGAISDAVGGRNGEGQSIVVRQFDINGGEMVTVEFVDRFGISHGEYGTQSGRARVGVGVVGGTMWSDVDGNGNPINNYFEPTDPAKSETNIYMSDEMWEKAFNKASGLVQQGFYGSNPYSGNTVDYAAEILGGAGFGYGDMANFFDPTSLTSGFLTNMDWLNQPAEFYADIWASGNNADSEAEWHLWQIDRSTPILGETDEYGQMQQRVADGIGSPIVIDLNGNGISSIAAEFSNVKFDVTGDKVADKVGWLSGEDAFLAVDRNGNGLIDDVSELFGGLRRGEGFAELSQFDSNFDKILDSQDKKFNQLLLWQDKNVDGVTDSGELSAAAPVLKALDLNYSSQEQRDSAGNLIGEMSSAWLGDNKVQLADIYFRYFDGSETPSDLKNDVRDRPKDPSAGPQVGPRSPVDFAHAPGLDNLIESMAAFAPTTMDLTSFATVDQRATSLIFASPY